MKTTFMDISNYDYDIQKAINNFIDEANAKKEALIYEKKTLKEKLSKIDEELEKLKSDIE